jgi:hypothetical protein
VTSKISKRLGISFHILLPVRKHGELVDDCRVEKPDVTLSVPNVFVRTSSVTSGTLTLRVQVVIFGKAFAFEKNKEFQLLIALLRFTDFYKLYLVRVLGF